MSAFGFPSSQPTGATTSSSSAFAFGSGGGSVAGSAFAPSSNVSTFGSVATGSTAASPLSAFPAASTALTASSPFGGGAFGGGGAFSTSSFQPKTTLTSSELFSSSFGNNSTHHDHSKEIGDGGDVSDPDESRNDDEEDQENDNGQYFDDDDEGTHDDDGDGDDAPSSAPTPPPPQEEADDNNVGKKKRTTTTALSDFRAFATNRENVPADRMPIPTFLPPLSPSPSVPVAPRSAFGAAVTNSVAPSSGGISGPLSTFAFGSAAAAHSSSTLGATVSPFGAAASHATTANMPSAFTSSAFGASSTAPSTPSVAVPPTTMAVKQSSSLPPMSPPPGDAFNPLGCRGGGGGGRGRGAFAQGRGSGAGILGVMDATSNMRPPAPRQVVAEAAHYSAPVSSSATLVSSSLDEQPMVKLFDMFLSRLAHTDAAKREGDTYSLLEKAFYQMPWNPNTPAACLTRMIEKATRAKPPTMRLKLERWAVVFFLGCNISILLQHLKSDGASMATTAEDDGASSAVTTWQEILKTALIRTNALADTYQELFNESRIEGGPDSIERKYVPYSTIRAILSRVRTAFEVGASVGFYEVASSQSQLLGAIVRRETAAVLFKPLSAPPVSEYQHILAQTQACIMCEFGALKSVTEIGRQFECAKAFHKFCPADVELRASLYFRNAQLIVQTQTMTIPNLNEAKDLLAHGLAICPKNHPNEKVIARWFAAVCFATGIVPTVTATSAAQAAAETGGDSPHGSVDLSWFEQYNLLREFGDAAVGLATANVALYEHIITHMLPHYTESGIASLMQYGRVHVRTAVVLGYFVAKGRNTQLSIEALVQYAGPMPKPYHHVTESGENFSRLWLMPLLLEKWINGVIVGDVLLVNKAKPFELHDIVGL